jgi:serine/threonine protein kinase
MLGKGAYATVYRHHDSDGDQALKHYTVDKGSGLSPAYREIELLSHLSHPNIVPMTAIYMGVYEHARKCSKRHEDGQLHVLMELAQCNLTEEIRKKLDDETAKKYTRDILLGLEYLHKNGVIHRDLNEGNVLLMQDGRLCICDLGMSKHFLSELEVNDDYVHPFVRSPEMHAKKSYDYRADIWSVGVLVVSMLMGSNPFSENARDSVRDLIRHIPLLPDKQELVQWIEASTSARVDSFTQLIERRYSGLEGLPDITDTGARDFLSHCLAFRRKDRWSAAQLLDHPWLSAHHKYIKEHRVEHLSITMPDFRAWKDVRLPPSPVRDSIRRYIHDNRDRVASHLDRMTSRICLALNLYYRLINRRVTKDDDENTTTSVNFIQDEYARAPFSLFVIAFIVTMKYCATNNVLRTSQFIPYDDEHIYTNEYITERESHIIQALNNTFYQQTTYDVLVSKGMRVNKDSCEQVWMRYLSGVTRTCNIEKEYEEHLTNLMK